MPFVDWKAIKEVVEPVFIFITGVTTTITTIVLLLDRRKNISINARAINIGKYDVVYQSSEVNVSNKGSIEIIVKNKRKADIYIENFTFLGYKKNLILKQDAPGKHGFEDKQIPCGRSKTFLFYGQRFLDTFPEIKGNSLRLRIHLNLESGEVIKSKHFTFQKNLLKNKAEEQANSR